MLSHGRGCINASFCPQQISSFSMMFARSSKSSRNRHYWAKISRLETPLLYSFRHLLPLYASFYLGQIRLYAVLDMFSHMGRFFYGDVGPHTFLLNYCALIRSLKFEKVRFSIISLRDRHGLSWDFGRLPISRNWTTFALVIFKVY